MDTMICACTRDGKCECGPTCSCERCPSTNSGCEAVSLRALLCGCSETGVCNCGPSCVCDKCICKSGACEAGTGIRLTETGHCGFEKTGACGCGPNCACVNCICKSACCKDADLGAGSKASESHPHIQSAL